MASGAATRNACTVDDTRVACARVLGAGNELVIDAFVVVAVVVVAVVVVVAAVDFVVVVTVDFVVVTVDALLSARDASRNMARRTISTPNDGKFRKCTYTYKHIYTH